MFSARADILGKSFWALPAEETLAILETSREGLTQAEAESRLTFFGRNLISDGEEYAQIKIFLRQLANPLILVLVIAGGITVFLQDYKDAVFIFAAVLVNSVLGFYQENKAEASLKGLKSYLKRWAVAKRGGRFRKIPADELAPGDIVRISAGDRVPADVRLTESSGLLADQSALTGESLAVEKKAEETSFQAPLADRHSMIYLGSAISEGFGEGVVTATGADTELGRIASLVKTSEETKTPLQKKISELSLQIGVFLVVLVGLFFVGGYFAGYSLLNMFITAVAIGVSAVPEGLPIAVTIVLAVGVSRLAKRKGVVRHLLAAETLGSTSVILTDKTGTLTEARMSLAGVTTWGVFKEEDVLRFAVLNTRVFVENPESNFRHWILGGSPLEKAVVLGAAEKGVLLPKVDDEITEKLPFSPLVKFSASASQNSRHFTVSLMGAPEMVLERCTLGSGEKERILSILDERARSGERVLGVAASSFQTEPRENLKTLVERHKFSFAGLLSFRDPVRSGLYPVIGTIERSGVKTVIVTGDHRGTAEAVAREIGLPVNGDSVLDGIETDLISDEELTRKLPLLRIVSRVTPANKVRIVKAYQAQGETVAMVGDGVNDAPALKQADIGVAVGSGTDVAREVSDLVILDDNFGTLVEAVSEGRRILQAIRKVIIYLLSSILDEIFLLGGAIVTGLPLPMNALQLLWVNFIADSVPAAALAFDRGENHWLAKGANLKKTLFDSEMKFLIWLIGVSSSALLFGLYFALIKMGYDAATVRTFIFLCFGLYSIFLILSIRNLHQNIFFYNPFSNKFINLSILASAALMAAGIYLKPLQNFFGTVPLGLPWIIGLFLFVLFNMLLIEIVKWFYRVKSA